MGFNTPGPRRSGEKGHVLGNVKSGLKAPGGGDTFDGEGIYFGALDDSTYRYDDEGNEVWESPGTTETGGPGPPELAGGALYAGATDIYSISPSDGSINWTYSKADQIDCTPVAKDGVVYAGGWDTAHVVAVNASDGSEIWKVTNAAVATEMNIADGSVYFTATGNDTITALNASDGSIKWRYSAEATFGLSVTIIDGVLYSHDGFGTIFALDTADGSEIWTQSGSPSNPSAVVDGVMYVPEQGSARAYDTVDGSLLWTHSPPNQASFGAPAIHDGHVYWGNNLGVFYKNSIADGSVEWSKSYGDVNDSNPAIENDVVYFSNTNGDLVALNISDGSEVWTSAANDPRYGIVLAGDVQWSYHDRPGRHSDPA